MTAPAEDVGRRRRRRRGVGDGLVLTAAEHRIDHVGQKLRQGRKVELVIGQVGEQVAIGALGQLPRGGLGLVQLGQLGNEFGTCLAHDQTPVMSSSSRAETSL